MTTATAPAPLSLDASAKIAEGVGQGEHIFPEGDVSIPDLQPESNTSLQTEKTEKTTNVRAARNAVKAKAKAAAYMASPAAIAERAYLAGQASKKGKAASIAIGSIAIQPIDPIDDVVNSSPTSPAQETIASAASIALPHDDDAENQGSTNNDESGAEGSVEIRPEDDEVDGADDKNRQRHKASSRSSREKHRPGDSRSKYKDSDTKRVESRRRRSRSRSRSQDPVSRSPHTNARPNRRAYKKESTKPSDGKLGGSSSSSLKYSSRRNHSRDEARNRSRSRDQSQEAVSSSKHRSSKGTRGRSSKTHSGAAQDLTDRATSKTSRKPKGDGKSLASGANLGPRRTESTPLPFTHRREGSPRKGSETNPKWAGDRNLEAILGLRPVNQHDQSAGESSTEGADPTPPPPPLDTESGKHHDRNNHHHHPEQYYKNQAFLTPQPTSHRKSWSSYHNQHHSAQDSGSRGLSQSNASGITSLTPPNLSPIGPTPFINSMTKKVASDRWQQDESLRVRKLGSNQQPGSISAGNTPTKASKKKVEHFDKKTSIPLSSVISEGQLQASEEKGNEDWGSSSVHSNDQSPKRPSRYRGTRKGQHSKAKNVGAKDDPQHEPESRPTNDSGALLQPPGSTDMAKLPMAEDVSPAIPDALVPDSTTDEEDTFATGQGAHRGHSPTQKEVGKSTRKPHSLVIGVTSPQRQLRKIAHNVVRKSKKILNKEPGSAGVEQQSSSSTQINHGTGISDLNESKSSVDEKNSAKISVDDTDKTVKTSSVRRPSMNLMEDPSSGMSSQQKHDSNSSTIAGTPEETSSWLIHEDGMLSPKTRKKRGILRAARNRMSNFLGKNKLPNTDTIDTWGALEDESLSLHRPMMADEDLEAIKPIEMNDDVVKQDVEEEKESEMKPVEVAVNSNVEGVSEIAAQTELRGHPSKKIRSKASELGNDEGHNSSSSVPDSSQNVSTDPEKHPLSPHRVQSRKHRASSPSKSRSTPPTKSKSKSAQSSDTEDVAKRQSVDESNKSPKLRSSKKITERRRRSAGDTANSVGRSRSESLSRKSTTIISHRNRKGRGAAEKESGYRRKTRSTSRDKSTDAGPEVEDLKKLQSRERRKARSSSPHVLRLATTNPSSGKRDPTSRYRSNRRTARSNSPGSLRREVVRRREEMKQHRLSESARNLTLEDSDGALSTKSTGRIRRHRGTRSRSLDPAGEVSKQRAKPQDKSELNKPTRVDSTEDKSLHDLILGAKARRKRDAGAVANHEPESEIPAPTVEW